MAAPSLLKPTTHNPGSSDLYGTAANGSPRIQIGNLADYTDPNGVSSPAEVGIRVLDQAGGIIMDTVGVASSAITNINGSGSGIVLGEQTITSSAWTTTDAFVTFTLARPASVMAWYSASCGIASVASGYQGHTCMGVDTTTPTGSAQYGFQYWLNTGLTPATGFAIVYGLAAGSHTITVLAEVLGAASITVGWPTINVAVIGS